MSRDYKLSTLFYQMPASDLERFFARHRVLEDFDFQSYRRSQRHLLLDAIQALPAESQAAVGWNLRDIFSLSTTEGAAIIEESVAALAPERRSEVNAIRNPYSRAMWLYLESGDQSDGLFEHCLILNQAQQQRFSSARKLRSLPRLTPSTSRSTLLELERAVSATYRNQGNGAGCKVKYARRESPTRHCFVATQEDISQTKFEFQGDQLRRVGQRGTVMVVYVYYPDQGVLELAAPGRMERARPLQESFCRIVLDMAAAPTRERGHSQRLNAVRARDFAFERDPEDDITRIAITGARLRDVCDETHRIALERNAGGTVAFDTWLRSTLKQVEPDLRFWDIELLRFQVTFGDSGRARGGHLTFTLTDSGTCSLKDKPQHLLLRRYLRRWNLMA